VSRRTPLNRGSRRPDQAPWKPALGDPFGRSRDRLGFIRWLFAAREGVFGGRG
jgi:hypothetical protein